MATINTTDPKPGFVYNSDDDTWYPLVGIAPASTVTRWAKTMTGGETSVSGLDDTSRTLSYTSGAEQVFLNGVLLSRGSDYTATNGTTISGFSPALSASDIVEVVSLSPSNIIKTNAVLTTDYTAKGDLISASAASTTIRVPVGTNGYILSANSATTSGLEWIANDVGDITAVTAGTGLSGGGTSGGVTLSVDTAVVATTNNTLTMSAKTLSTPIFIGPTESLNVIASAPTATQAIDSLTSGIHYFTTASTSNMTLNFRGSATTSMNTLLATNGSVTVNLLFTNGGTAYIPNVFQVDGTTSAVSVKWSGGTAPSAGNASAIDAYSFTIIKTASATYTVLAAGAIKYS